MLNRLTKKVKIILSSLAVAILTFVIGVLVFSNFNITQYFNNAKASLNCPAGSTANQADTQCISNIPTSYTCPSGQTLSGTDCYTYGIVSNNYSCPHGGNVSGANCVANSSNPVNIVNVYPFTTFDGSGSGNCNTFSCYTETQYFIESPLSYCVDGGYPGTLRTLNYPGYFGASWKNGSVVCTVNQVNPSTSWPYRFVHSGPAGTYAASGSAVYGNILAGPATPVYATAVNALISPQSLSSGEISLACGTNNTVILSTATSYSPTSVPTTTCSGLLPASTVLDSSNNLTLRVGNIGNGNLAAADKLESADCTIGTLGSGANGTTPFTCSEVPVGSLTGASTIFAKLGNSNATSGYGTFLTSTSSLNVYPDIEFSDGDIKFLKGVTGETDGFNAILHNDWRRGVNGNETRISLRNFKTFQNPLVNSDTQYICNIGVRPAGSTASFINLAYDANENGTIETLETNSDIPYSATNNNCTTLFTNANFTGGQFLISNSLSKNYAWEVQIQVKDTLQSNSPVVATFKSGIGFKFAAAIPGG